MKRGQIHMMDMRRHGWSKDHIKEHNQKFTLSAVKDLTYEGFRRVGPEQRRKNISHVRDKVEDHYWIADNLQEEYIPLHKKTMHIIIMLVCIVFLCVIIYS